LLDFVGCGINSKSSCFGKDNLFIDELVKNLLVNLQSLQKLPIIRQTVASKETPVGGGKRSSGYVDFPYSGQRRTVCACTPSGKPWNQIGD
jgi:hypothetical protein